MKLALAALALSLAIFFTVLVATVRELPPHIASHFNFAGRPDGWMDHTRYLQFTIGTALGLPAFMLALTALAGRWPGLNFKIPHRDYWLAPERRQATVAILLQYILVLCCIVVLLFAAVQLLIVAANIDPARPRLDLVAMWSVLAGVSIAIGVWCWKLHGRFARVP